MKKLKMHPKLAAGLIATACVVTAGVAFATWTANGTGSAEARARTAQTVTVNASTGAADLYPGFTQGDLHFTLTNTNPYPVQFTSLTPGAITSSAPVACPSSNLTVASASALTLNVAANATSAPLSVADVVSLATGAPDGCQGVTFTVAATMVGSQV
jgi:hypothetical protein